MRINKIAFLFLITLVSCNLSDDAVLLPGGHTYVNEGKCYKVILVNIKGKADITSCVDEYRYDNKFIVASQIDSFACTKEKYFPIKQKRFYIIDITREQIYGPLNYTQFDSMFVKLSVDKKLFIHAE